MFLPPLIPLLDPVLEDFEMFRIRHCRVTSLASAMLRMILTVCFEGHTLCDSPRPVNAQTSQREHTQVNPVDERSSSIRRNRMNRAGPSARGAAVPLAQGEAEGGTVGRPII